MDTSGVHEFEDQDPEPSINDDPDPLLVPIHTAINGSKAGSDITQFFSIFTSQNIPYDNQTVEVHQQYPFTRNIQFLNHLIDRGGSDGLSHVIRFLHWLFVVHIFWFDETEASECCIVRPKIQGNSHGWLSCIIILIGCFYSIVSTTILGSQCAPFKDGCISVVHTGMLSYHYDHTTHHHNYAQRCFRSIFGRRVAGSSHDSLCPSLLSITPNISLYFIYYRWPLGTRLALAVPPC